MRPNTPMLQQLVKNLKGSSIFVYAIPKGLLSYIPNLPELNQCQTHNCPMAWFSCMKGVIIIHCSQPER